MTREDQLKSIVGLLQSSATKEEVLGAFQQVLKVVKDHKEQNATEWSLIHSAFQMLESKLHETSAKGLEDIKGQVNHVFVQDRLSQIEKDLHGKVDAKLATVRHGKDGKAGPQGKQGNPGVAGIPAEPPSEEQLLALIMPLIPTIEDIVKQVPKQVPARASNSTQFFDLSAHTNGTLKVFAVPEGLAGVLFSSDFPNVLMEGRGFTLNKSRTQLTMTTDNAPSAGSQLLYQFISIGNYYG